VERNTNADNETLLRRCYEAFNRRDLDGALTLMHRDVTWPNGWRAPGCKGRSVAEHLRTEDLEAIESALRLSY
jgi:ketosteroid isomerase-like protein